MWEHRVFAILMVSPTTEQSKQNGVVNAHSSEGIGRSQQSYMKAGKSFCFWAGNLSLCDVIPWRNAICLCSTAVIWEIAEIVLSFWQMEYIGFIITGDQLTAQPGSFITTLSLSLSRWRTSLFLLGEVCYTAEYPLPSPGLYGEFHFCRTWFWC